VLLREANVRAHSKVDGKLETSVAKSDFGVY
jgi:hypothetical protein